MAEVDASYKRGDPVLFVVWEPHWAHAKYDLTQLEMPAWTEACYPDGPEFNCGWAPDPVAKLVWPGLKDQSPEAYQFLNNFTITTAQQNEMVLNVGQEGMTPLEAAQLWIDANEDIWKPWIP